MSTNTGYRLDYMRDFNPRSPYYNTVSVFRTYDIDTCPITLSGSLYYSYYGGTESYYDWTSSTLSGAYNNGSSAVTIIDYGGTVKILSNFNVCSSRLRTISFPAVEYVYDSAFYSCSNLTTVSLPMVTSIGSYAFAYCTSLTTVSLPQASYIGDGAFYSCGKLSVIYVPAENISTLNSVYSSLYVGIMEVNE